MVNVRLRPDVYRELKELKKRMGFNSISDTVAWLLKRATSPAAFIEAAAFFMEDMRGDVKMLLEELRRLRRLLEEG